MQSDKKYIPYKVQKGSRPQIEEVVASCLDGGLMVNAQEFVQFMQANQMPFKIYTSTTRSQRASYKGKPICHIIVYAEDDWNYVAQHYQGEPPYWSISPNLIHMSEYENIIINEKLQSLFWDNIFYCTHYAGNGIGCSPNKVCAGGRVITILGKEISGICRSRPNAVIKNPDEATLETIKRLLELEKMARDKIAKTSG